MAKKYVGANSLYLAGSGSIVSATSITLTTFTDIYGDTLTMSDFGDLGYITFEPDTTNQEFATFTGVTANANTTFTLTGVKTALAKSPYTQTSGLTRSHSGGTKVVISDSPAFWDTFANKANTNTYDLVQTFTVLPESNGGNAINPTQLVTYAQALALSTGTAAVNRTVVAGTAGEIVAADQLVYLKNSDGRWWLADADTAATDENVILGITQGAGTAGVAITSGVLTYGLNTFSAAIVTANTKYYASNTAGGFSTTPGITEVTVGYALSTTTMFFNPRYDQQLTEDQQDALVGTSGTPSSTNKYVTNDDTSATPSANKVVRYDASGLLPAPTKIGTSLLAGESLTAGDAVCSYYYQSDGGITYDAKTTNNGFVTSGGGTVTFSHTTANQTNRMMILYISVGSSSGTVPTPTVTYNSVSMSAVQTQASSPSDKLFSFSLAAPSTGANNIVITLGASAQTNDVSSAVTTYYNVSALENNVGTTGTGVAYGIPAPGVLLSSGSSRNAGTASVNNNNNFQDTGINSFARCVSGDSGIAFTKSSATVTYGGSMTNITVIGLTPTTTPVYGYVVKSSAATPANGVNLNKYTTFAGFAQSTVSAAASVTVTTDGTVTGLTGLTPLSTYFLSNTGGAISTTAGTNSKKVGFAETSTTLLMRDTI